jgi:outer membrane protein assembly factor BamA
LTSLALAALLALTLPAAAPARPQPAPAVAREAAPPLVGSLELRLPPGEPTAALEPLVVLREGEPLSRRALRRTVQALYQTGRFSSVTVHSRLRADGRVDVVVECSARRLVREVRVRRPAGSRREGPDDAALVRAAGLAAGQDVSAERLSQASARVRAELFRRGWRAAVVEARDDAGVVELAVDEGAPTRVRSLELAGEPGPAAGALGDLRTRPGAVLDEAALDADVARLRAGLRERGYLRARVDLPRLGIEGTDARVVIPVAAGPVVRFRFSGQRTVDAAYLESRLGLELDQPLDPAAVEAAAARLRAMYRQRGNADARVTTREASAPGAVVILFEIEEGPRFRVGAVRFEGAEHRDARWLRARLDEALESGAADGEGADVERAARAMGSPAPRGAGPPRLPAETYDPDAWNAAIGRIVDQLRTDGYLEAGHEGTQVALDARRGIIDVVVRLREGPRTLVSAVTFEGNTAIAAAELDRESKLATGAPLSYGAIEQTRAAVLGLYGRRGHLYARVADEERISDDRTSAAVRFKIEEGPRVRVGNVVVTGNRRTREDLVRGALSLREGDAYDPDAAARSQAALLRLGVFRSVGVRLSDPDVVEETKDLTVELAERPWRSVAPGIGFSIANGPRATLELVQPNLLGLAVEGSARAKVNYPLGTFRPDLAAKPPQDRIEFRTELGVHDPRVPFVPLPAGARADVIVERVHRRAYELARGSALFGVDVAATSRASLSLQYELELDHVLKSDAVNGITLTRADVERLRFPEGYTTLQSIRPVFTLDYRDNSVHPRSGWLASTTLEYVRSIGSGQDSWLFGLVRGSGVLTNMLKASSVVSAYAPVAGDTVLALSLRGGRVLPLDPESQTIGPKRFFLGGASTMRGFGEDEMLPEDRREPFLEQLRACAGSLSGAACSEAARQIAAGKAIPSEGGEAFLLAKAELRVPVRGAAEAGFFVDAGNLWLDPRNATFRSLRFDVGVGLRLATPIGPAALDLGMNLAPDERLGEPVFSPHFSIGLF